MIGRILHARDEWEYRDDASVVTGDEGHDLGTCVHGWRRAISDRNGMCAAEMEEEREAEEREHGAVSLHVNPSGHVELGRCKTCRKYVGR